MDDNVRGIVRRLDDLGRVVIPREIRRLYGLSEGMALEMTVTNGGILLKPYFPSEDLRLGIRALENLITANKDLLPDDRYNVMLEHATAIKRAIPPAQGL